MIESACRNQTNPVHPRKLYPQVLLPCLQAAANIAVLIWAFRTLQRHSPYQKGTKRQRTIKPRYMSKLAETNKHPRDERIQFEANGHMYTIDGQKGKYTSVTTWGGSHFPKFNPDEVIKGMMSSPKWPESKYFGMSPDAIKRQWDTSGIVASTLGTKLHEDIELTLDGNDIQNSNKDYQHFLTFQKEKLADCEPYRTEWTIFDEEHKLAGSIDFAAMRPDGKIDLYDWKRTKEIKTSGFGRTAIPSFLSHIPDANFWKYALQLNIYRSILERCYGFEINSMTIVCLYPDNPSYELYDVPRLDNELNLMLAERKNRLETAAKAKAAKAKRTTSGGKKAKEQ